MAAVAAAREVESLGQSFVRVVRRALVDRYGVERVSNGERIAAAVGVGAAGVATGLAAFKRRVRDADVQVPVELLEDDGSPADDED